MATTHPVETSGESTPHSAELQSNDIKAPVTSIEADHPNSLKEQLRQVASKIHRDEGNSSEKALKQFGAVEGVGGLISLLGAPVNLPKQTT